jgi:hypothetical protein
MAAQSVSRELNPPVRGGSPMPLPLGQRHILFFIINQRIIPLIDDLHSAEGEGVEPSRPCSSSVFKTVAIANWLALPNDSLHGAYCGRVKND